MKKFTKPLASFFLILLAIAGLADCLAISGSINLSEGQCSGFGSCDKVLNSTYADIKGVSLWKFGTAFYIFYTTLLITAVLKNRRPLLFLCLLFLIGGTSFSLYLIYLQAFRIQSWCPLCLLSAGIQMLSLAGCFYLWVSGKSKNQDVLSAKKRWKIELAAGLLVSSVILGGLLHFSNTLWDKVAIIEAHQTGQSEVVTQLDDNIVELSDFPEYLTMRREFDQFIWTKAKQWYRAKLLSHAAEKKGFPNSTAFVHEEYIKSGGLIDIDADEAVRRFMAFQKNMKTRENPSLQMKNSWLSCKLVTKNYTTISSSN